MGVSTLAMFKNKEKKEKKETPQLTWQQNVSLYLHDIVYMLVFLMILLMLFFRVIIVNGPSMQNTLQDGDFMLLISNMFYKTPQYGDVVVLAEKSYDNGKAIVKRVIATEGQTVDIDFEQGTVTVDGQVLDEPYISTPTMRDERTFDLQGEPFHQVVEAGHVFVMGDNRMNSKDSRSAQIGQVDTREVLGKVIFILFPGTGLQGTTRDYSRIGAVR